MTVHPPVWPAVFGRFEAELLELVIAGPDPALNGVVRRRCVDLQAEVARRFGVTVHENTIGRWLHELGLTRLQPRPCHPRKDVEAEAAFKNELCAQVRDTYDEILDACQSAWRFLINDPDRIRSIGARQWACVSH